MEERIFNIYKNWHKTPTKKLTALHMKSKQKQEAFKSKEELFKNRTGQPFEFYYNKYYQKLIYYTSKMCKDTQKAEDVTTDSFLIAYEKIDMYERDKAQFSTWLFTIAKNLMLQELKNNKKTISIDMEIDQDGTTMKDFLPDHESNEHVNNLNTMKFEIMREHISELKEPYKTVMEMREIHKMQYKDIADKTGVLLSTLKSRIRCARIILRKQTEKEFEKLDDKFLQ